MENTWFVILFFLALFFVLSGTRLLLPGTRRSAARIPSSNPQPPYPAAKPHPLHEQPTSNMTPQAAYPAPVSKGLPASPANGRPHVVAGSDYLHKNPSSHLYSYRTGSDGEQRIVEHMLDVLDAQWTIFRNLDLCNGEGDIDIVLVGPGGIWAFEVKTYTGNFKVENGRWYKETSNGHMARLRPGPGAQVIGNAMRLCAYLKEHGITHDSYVDRAVVMSGDASVEVVSAGTDIWMLDELDVQLASLKARKRCQHDHVRHVVSLLERACSAETGLH